VLSVQRRDVVNIDMEQFLRLDELAFRPLPDASIRSGGTGCGYEEKESVIWLNLQVATPIGPDDQPCGEVVRLAIALTPAQYAQVVKQFFWDVTVGSSLMAKFLKRLLQKRWAIMTNELAKEKRWPETHLPRYDNLP
jgi:hypothetical protein